MSGDADPFSLAAWHDLQIDMGGFHMEIGDIQAVQPGFDSPGLIINGLPFGCRRRVIQKTGIDDLSGIIFQGKIGMLGQLVCWEHAQGPAESPCFFAFVQDISDKLAGDRRPADFFWVGFAQVGDGFRGMQINAAIERLVELPFAGRLKDHLFGIGKKIKRFFHVGCQRTPLHGIQPHFKESGIENFRQRQGRGIIADQHDPPFSERFGSGCFQPPDQRVGVTVQLNICQHFVSSYLKMIIKDDLLSEKDDDIRCRRDGLSAGG